MVWVPGGRFVMGSDHHYPEEAPAHQAEVGGFWMDRAPVTNAEFRKFIKATGYQTQAERPADPADYPGARPEQLHPASIVFLAPTQPVPLDNIHAWWHYLPGANWRHPEGPGSSIKGREQHLADAAVRARARALGLMHAHAQPGRSVAAVVAQQRRVVRVVHEEEVEVAVAVEVELEVAAPVAPVV